jgi:hypothetical protein
MRQLYTLPYCIMAREKMYQRIGVCQLHAALTTFAAMELSAEQDADYKE